MKREQWQNNFFKVPKITKILKQQWDSNLALPTLDKHYKLQSFTV